MECPVSFNSLRCSNNNPFPWGPFPSLLITNALSCYGTHITQQLYLSLDMTLAAGQETSPGSAGYGWATSQAQLDAVATHNSSSKHAPDHDRDRFSL